MGHVRLGRLPKTRLWNEVVDLLDDSPHLTNALAATIVDASDYRLVRLANDDSLSYAFWLLTRITTAARGGDFTEELRKLGLISSAHVSVLSLISDIADKVRQRTAENVDS